MDLLIIVSEEGLKLRQIPSGGGLSREVAQSGCPASEFLIVLLRSVLRNSVSRKLMNCRLIFDKPSHFYFNKY
jgi:hypothetical protein